MKKIMVFDEPGGVGFLVDALGEKCDVVWTSSEDEVLSLFQRERPDAVLINYETSEEGFHCCRFNEVLKGIRAEDSKVPILLMTEKKAVLDIPTFVSGTVFKPLEKENLEYILRRYRIL